MKDRWLDYLKEEIQEGDTMRCTICGREVKVQKKGKGPLVCCGKNMIRRKQ